MKIAIGCIMLCMFFVAIICGMGFMAGWKVTATIWAVSIGLAVWIKVAVFLMRSKTTKTPQAGSLKGQ